MVTQSLWAELALDPGIQIPRAVICRQATLACPVWTEPSSHMVWSLWGMRAALSRVDPAPLGVQTQLSAGVDPPPLGHKLHSDLGLQPATPPALLLPNKSLASPRRGQVGTAFRADLSCSLWGRVLRHRGAGAPASRERGFREVCRRPPQHREVRHPAAENHQAGRSCWACVCQHVRVERGQCGMQKGPGLESEHVGVGSGLVTYTTDCGLVTLPPWPHLALTSRLVSGPGYT